MEPVNVGRYAIGEVLGTGAMGEVRAALDLHDGRAVAVKLLTAAAARNPAAGEVFAREVRAVARLNHRAVIQIHDQGVLDPDAARRLGLPAASPWFAMERAEWSAQRAFRRWSDLRVLLLDLLEGLAYCHARDLVHRDLKPGNVLYIDGVWKLADFGLCVPLHELGSNIAGTPLYMAPEQFNAPGEVGPWSDLYALGCLVWARCTGTPPFVGDLRALQQAHTYQPLPELESQFEIPSRFRMWLQRMLAKDPTRRFDHAADARRALLDLAPETTPRSGRTAAGPRGTALIGLRELPLIGRDRERDALVDRLLDTLAREARTLHVIDGVAGTGKSFLATHVAHHAAELGLVRLVEIRHQATDTGGEGLADLAQRLLVRPRSPLSGVARTVAEAWVDFHSPTPPIADRLAALLDGIDTLNRSRPTLLLVDDLQWGRETRALVERLLVVGPRPLFVLATERIEPGAGSVLPAEWERTRLGGLSPETAEQLAAEVLGQDSFRALQLAEISQGSPLLAVQLAVHFAQTGRFAVQSDPLQAWRTRLDSVLAAHPDLWPSLLVGAVLGGEVHDREWARLRPDNHALDGLVRACLAEETPHGWRLAHPLLVQAVRARASDAVWVRLNTTAATALVDADPLRRARMFLAAGNHTAALELALHVSREAHWHGDFGRRKMAWTVAERCDTVDGELAVRRDVAGLWEHINDLDPDEALNRAATLVARADSGACWRLMMYIRIRRAEFEAAGEALERAEQRSPGDPANGRARLQLAIRAGRFADAHQMLEAAGPPATGDAYARARWYRSVGRVAFGLNDFATAEIHLREAMDLAERSGSMGLANVIRGELGEVVRWLGRPDESVRMLQQVVQRDLRFGTVAPVARLNLALALLESGNPQRAGALLGELHEQPGVWREIESIALAALGRALGEQGLLEDVPGVLAQITSPSHDPDYRTQLEVLKGLATWDPALERRVDALLAQLDTHV
ncbi:MAG: protein kinase [Myxococcota bacterium]